MLDENEANQANFDQVERHLARIREALEKKTLSTEQREHLLADQEDYYEQGIKYRQMQSETYREERDEARNRLRHVLAGYNRLYWQRVITIMMLVAVIGALVCETYEPGKLQALADQTPTMLILSYVGAVLLGVALSSRPKKKND